MRSDNDVWYAILVAGIMLGTMSIPFVEAWRQTPATQSIRGEQTPVITAPKPVSDRTEILRRVLGLSEPISFSHQGLTVFEGNKPLVVISLAYLDVLYDRQEEMLSNQKKMLEQQRQILELLTSKTTFLRQNAQK